MDEKLSTKEAIVVICIMAVCIGGAFLLISKFVPPYEPPPSWTHKRSPDSGECYEYYKGSFMSQVDVEACEGGK